MRPTESPYLAPVLLATYPILFIYGVNVNATAFLPVLWPLMISVAVTLSLLSLFRDKVKGCLIVSLVLVLFFAYGHIHSAIHQGLINWGVGYEFFDKTLSLRMVLHVVLYLYFATLTMVSVRRIIRTDGKKLSGLMKVVNVVSLVLVLLLVTTMVGKLSAQSHASNLGPLELLPSLQSSSGVVEELGYKPDIYYIILDGYGRQDVLKQHYGFDNKEFDDFLEKRGFFVNQGSRANYFMTFLSLASSLNMNYVNFLAETPGRQSQDQQQAIELIRNSQVSRRLKDIGYSFVHFKSTYGPTNMNPYADVLVAGTEGIFQNEFYRVLFNSTMLRILRPLVCDDLAQHHLTSLQKLTAIGAMEGPKFVFSHILPPHHPYLFDRDGRVLRHATMLNQMQFQKNLWSEKGQYVDQLIFVNRKIQEVIEGIFEQSENQPIIIIQSDHGPQLLTSSMRPHDDYLHARSGIFLAVFTPGAKAGLLPTDVTPVNLFRLLFNAYFYAGYKILPNRHYISSYEHPYAFKEIEFLPHSQQAEARLQ